jgi:hypothetical protein
MNGSDKGRERTGNSLSNKVKNGSSSFHQEEENPFARFT